LALNGIYHLLAYDNDVTSLGDNTHNIKKDTEALIVASKEADLEVKTEKRKYRLMLHHQNAG
jgi:hypothetical protein